MRIKSYSIFIAIIAMLLMTTAGCSKQTTPATVDNVITSQSELLLSVPPSLKGSFEEIKTVYAAKQPNVKLTFNYGPSGALKNQIVQGAAADVFISQGIAEIDELEQKGLLKAGSRVNLLSDELVLIVNKSNTSINSFDDLKKSDVKKIGIGEMQTVPAAKIAQQTLETLKLWDALQPKLVVGKDLMQLTAWVESGDADAGLVWDTIAITSNKVRVAARAESSWHKPIVIPAAIIASSKNSDQAADLLTFLQSEEGMKIFAKNGFVKAK